MEGDRHRGQLGGGIPREIMPLDVSHLVAERRRELLAPPGRRETARAQAPAPAGRAAPRGGRPPAAGGRAQGGSAAGSRRWRATADGNNRPPAAAASATNGTCHAAFRTKAIAKRLAVSIGVFLCAL